jgi:hypothetical protein
LLSVHTFYSPQLDRRLQSAVCGDSGRKKGNFGHRRTSREHAGLLASRVARQGAD